MARELVIEDTRIADDTDCYVIAEIGHNHQGKVETAMELIRAAKECGANAAKFQKRDNRTLYTRELYNKPYDHENSFGKTYGQHREALELGLDQYRELKRFARDIGIALFATAFDFASADFLMDLGVPAFKIASGDLTNTPLLRHVAEYGKPVIVSTGGGTMEEVQRAYDTVMPINRQLCLLQCTAAYPCAFEEMNLRVISTYRERFPGAVVGLSAHDSGIAMVTAAYVMGGRVVEKHFTLNRAMKGTDHSFSLERPGLSRVVRDLQRLRVALGDGVKQRYPSETNGLYKMAKKLVAARDIPAGHVVTKDDVAIKSPNNGLPPSDLDKVLGMKTLRPLSEDETIAFKDLTDNDRKR